MNGFVGGASGLNTGGLFTQPRDVAVYTASTPSTGDDKVFVVDAASNNNRLQRLDGHGNFERLWGRDVIRAGSPGNTGGGFEVCTAAVTGAAGCKSGMAGSAAGEFNAPTAVAVDQSTGHVYVMDRGNRRVQEFTLDGGFVRAWGWGVSTGADAFEICTASCQAGIAGAQPGQFGSSDTVTVNSIAISPVAPNDVYVTDGANSRILIFEQDGDFVRVADGGAFASGWPRHVAIDSGGVVYASDNDSPPGTLPKDRTDRIVRFDSDPQPDTPLVALGSPTPIPNGITAGLEVDPTTGNLLVGRDQSDDGEVVYAIHEIVDPGGPSPALGDTHTLAVDADDVAGGGGATRNLGIDPTNGNVYLVSPDLFAPSTSSGKFTGCVSPNHVCHGLIVFAATAGSLQGSLDAPSNVGTTTASLEGAVSPGGGVARYRFQVSSDGASWVDASEPAYVAGSGAIDVLAEVSGLEPATLYRVRLLVSKQTGIATTESVPSAEDVFLTDAAPPEVTTLGSAKRTDTGVRLRGLVDPQGSATTYRFEYGPAGGSFDHQVPIPDANAGSGNEAQLVTQDLVGLQPETAYHYRIVASSFVGAAIGQPVEFTTRAAVQPAHPQGRAYELVSPADDLAGVGVGIWYQGPLTAGLVGFPAYDGERFAVQGTFGAVQTDGEFSFANDWALSQRTPSGWVSKPLASRRAHGNQTLVFISPSAATSDLSLTAWGGTTVKLFAEMEEWAKEIAGSALFLRDWESGKWEIFGPTEEAQGGELTGSVTIAADGRSAVASGNTQGLTGPGDPTADLPTGVTSVYLDEVPNGLSDTFPGDGVRRLVNVCTPGTEIPVRVDMGSGVFKMAPQPCPPPDGGENATLVSGDRGAELGGDREHTISADGSRVFFMSPSSGGGPSCSGTGASTQCPTQLYVRRRNEDDSVTTRWVSKPEVSGQDASLLGPALFEGASSDGDKVFFRTSSPLTTDDRNGQGQAPPPGGVTSGTVSPTSWDLYMYDMPDGPNADPADGDLIRITAGPNGDGDCNSPVGGGSGSGALRYASEDGTTLYFTCAAPLSGVPVPDDGTLTSAGGTPSTSDRSNLYVYDASKPAEQRWRFVARLPRTSPLGSCATMGVRPGMPVAPKNEQDPAPSWFEEINCVRGTLDGSFITFMTDGQLTDDDPDSVSGDIYAYDAALDELVRVTAIQGGVGGTYPCRQDFQSASCYGDDGVGTPSGSMTLPKLGVAERAEGGRLVFFGSRSRLVPGDVNDKYDVYQWRDGGLSLVSTGLPGATDALFAGNDRTGLNVYVATRDRLTWQDRDAVLDVYTARIDGGIPEPPDTHQDCDTLGDGCQGPGGVPGPTQVASDAPAGGNPPQAKRVTLSLKELSRKVHRRAAHTGTLPVRVAASSSAIVRLVAKAPIQGRVRRVAAARREVAKAGTVKVLLRLASSSRKRLAAGRTLRLTLVATAPASRPATLRLALRR
jgi:hypothetical protein